MRLIVERGLHLSRRSGHHAHLHAGRARAVVLPSELGGQGAIPCLRRRDVSALLPGKSGGPAIVQLWARSENSYAAAKCGNTAWSECPLFSLDHCHSRQPRLFMLILRDGGEMIPKSIQLAKEIRWSRYGEALVARAHCRR